MTLKLLLLKVQHQNIAEQCEFRLCHWNLNSAKKKNENEQTNLNDLIFDLSLRSF